MDKFKSHLGSMWRITGGILLFNIIRKITHAIQGLISTVLDYDEALHNITSVTGNKGKDLAELNNMVIDLALDPRIKSGPTELAQGLYTIVSSGYEAKDALVVLEQAALAATAGLSTTGVAADVIVSTLGAYNKGVDEAAKVTNSLFQIVAITKYTFDDMAGALDSVTPSAAALGISIDEIGAALAVYAKHGVDAQTATVQMNAILSALLKPTTAMTEAVHALGYENGQAMLDALGFGGTLKALAGYIGEDETKAAALFGDVRALRGEMNLMNDGGAAYETALKKMGEAQDGLGATTIALNEQMKSSAFQLAVLHKNFEILAVLGFGLIAPYLNKVLTIINTFISGTIKAFRHFREKGYTIFGSLRAAIKKTLQDMFGSDVVTPALKFFDKFVKMFYTLKKIVMIVAPVFKDLFLFLVKHFDILVPAILGAVIAMKAFGVVMAINNAILAITMFEMTPLIMVIILIAALGAFLAIAWSKNWLDIQGKTHTAVEFIGEQLSRFWEFIQPAIKVIKELGKYLHDVATGDIRPFGEALKRLPGWLQPIALILGRVVKSLRVFFKVWQDRGFIEAIKTIPMQIRAFGRAVAGLFNSMGLHRFAKAIRITFYDIAKLIKDVIEFVDDVVHGRWREAWNDFKNIALDLFWLFIDRFTLGFALLIDLFSMIPWGTIASTLWFGFKEAIGLFFAVAIPWMTIKGLETMAALYTAFVDFWNNTIGPWLGDLSIRFGMYFVDAGLWLYQAGNDLIGGLWNGVIFAIDWGFEWLKQIPEWIANIFVGTKDLLRWAGHEIMNGLWTGMVEVATWIYNHFKDLFGWMPKFMKDQLGIFSPSKVFAEIGRQIPAGLALGIEQGMGAVRSSMEGMSTTVTAPRMTLSSPMAAFGNSVSSNNTTIFKEGSIVVNGADSAERTAHVILREIRTRQASRR